MSPGSKGHVHIEGSGNYPSSVLDWCGVLRCRRRWLGVAALATLAVFGLAASLQSRVYRSTCSVFFPDGLPGQTSRARLLNLGLEQEYLQGMVRDRRLLLATRADASVQKWITTSTRPVAQRDLEVEFALDNLTVSAGPGGEVFYLKCDAQDPNLAALVANAVTRKLIDLDIDRQREREAATLAAGAQALRHLRAAMSAAENELRSSIRRGATQPREEQARWLDRLSRTNRELTKALADRTSAQARYETFANTPGNAPAGYSDRGWSRANRNNLAELRQKLAMAESILTPDHHRVRQLEAEIAASSAAEGGQEKITAEALKNDYLAAARREQAYSRDHLGALSAAARSLGSAGPSESRRRLDQARKLYDSVAEQLQRAESRENATTKQAKILDLAVPAITPIRPNLPLTAPFALVVGMLGCTLAIFVREDLGAAKTGAASPRLPAPPELASIPNHPEPLTLLYGFSSAADQYRNMRESILVWEKTLGNNGSGPIRRGTSLAFTGPKTAVGATTVACNLAISLARLGRKVLLVDANLSRPRLHNLFPALECPDLVNEFESSGPLPLNGRPRRTDIHRLFVLPVSAGDDSHGLNESSAAAFLDVAGVAFDFLIIDAPNALSTDGRIWAHVCDGIVLVVPSGGLVEEMSAALFRLRQSGARLVGTVVNEVGVSRKLPHWRPAPTHSVDHDHES